MKFQLEVETIERGWLREALKFQLEADICDGKKKKNKEKKSPEIVLNKLEVEAVIKLTASTLLWGRGSGSEKQRWGYVHFFATR